jgi:hypothetical protein
VPAADVRHSGSPGGICSLGHQPRSFKDVDGLRLHVGSGALLRELDSTQCQFLLRMIRRKLCQLSQTG